MPTKDGRQFCILYLSGLGDGLRWMLPLSEAFSRDYGMQSYVVYHSSADYKRLSLDQIARCDVLICHDPAAVTFADQDGYLAFLAGFPPRTRKIFLAKPRFPVFWPFHTEEQVVPPLQMYQPFFPAYRSPDGGSEPERPLSVRETPLTFPFGDDYVLTRLREGVPASAVVANYLGLAIDSVVNLDDLLAATLAGIAQNEQTADVKICDFIAGRFRMRRPFSTLALPSNAVLLHIANEILTLLGFPRLEDRVLDRLQPLIKVEAPIHPAIGRYFGLAYADETTRYLVDRHRYLTFREYIVEYVAFASGPCDAAALLPTDTVLPAAAVVPTDATAEDLSTAIASPSHTKTDEPT